MDKKLYEKLVHEGRDFMHHHRGIDRESWKSDQQKELPQPPLVKGRVGGEIIDLSKDFAKVIKDHDFLDLLIKRKSNRVYTEEKISLDELSFLLWAVQGVKGIRGNNYATLRTVPSGGARHPFETYLIVKNIEGLKGGLYHYLPLEHQLEFIKIMDGVEEAMDLAACKQSWVKKANVLFIFTCVAYRCEWRYGFNAHRPALIDLGHVGENLYLACASLQLGTCGIASFDDEYLNELIGIDGDEEYACYVQPVGTVKSSDQDKEDAFYSFLKR